MITYNGKNYFDLHETSQKTTIAYSTLQRYIKTKKITFITRIDTPYIPEAQVELLKKKPEDKKQVIITYEQSYNDVWLHDKQNLSKLKYWSEGLHINWGEMPIEDLIRYWWYLILPIWKKEENPTKIYPTVIWLVEHKFKSFKEAFEKRYWKKEGIETLQTFWEYVDRLL